MLAAGTSDGRAVVYHHSGSGSSSSSSSRADALSGDPASRWQAEPSFAVGGRPQALQWGPSSRLMAVQGSAGVSICCKTRLKCSIAGGLVALQVGSRSAQPCAPATSLVPASLHSWRLHQAAAPTATCMPQVSPDRVLLESLGPSAQPPGKISTGMQIRSMGLADGTLLVHDGEQAALYSLDAGKLEAARGGGFQCQAAALALLRSDAVVGGRLACLCWWRRT
jgi:hypothetical protein